MGAGVRIKQIREMMGLSQRELARRIGCSPQSVNKWEDESRTPSDSMLEAIAPVLRVSVEYLKGWVDVSERPVATMAERVHNAIVVGKHSTKIIAEQVGITEEELNRLFYNDFQPSFKIMEKLADVLGVSTRYLLGYGDAGESGDVKNAPLSPGLQKLVLHAQGLSAEDIERAIGIVDVLASFEKTNGEIIQFPRKKHKKKIPVKRYLDPPAAGAPLMAEAENYEIVEYDEDVVPNGTDYAVGISGNSMEPTLPDGCTVFVFETIRPANNDIVLAWLPQEQGAVCKRARIEGDRLVALASDNPNCESYSGDALQGAVVFGKVLGKA